MKTKAEAKKTISIQECTLSVVLIYLIILTEWLYLIVLIYITISMCLMVLKCLSLAFTVVGAWSWIILIQVYKNSLNSLLLKDLEVVEAVLIESLDVIDLSRGF